VKTVLYYLMMNTYPLGGQMIAYFVHDSKKEKDLIVLPDRGCSVEVTPQLMETFISVDPVFASWSGDSCADFAPEDFGTVVATRDDGGDVCVMDHEVWRQRMEHYLGLP
jgi:hypothetical protein